jgi:hypothetical protein
VPTLDELPGAFLQLREALDGVDAADRMHEHDLGKREADQRTVGGQRVEVAVEHVHVSRHVRVPAADVQDTDVAEVEPRQT